MGRDVRVLLRRRAVEEYKRERERITERDRQQAV